MLPHKTVHVSANVYSPHHYSSSGRLGTGSIRCWLIVLSGYNFGIYWALWSRTYSKSLERTGNWTKTLSHWNYNMPQWSVPRNFLGGKMNLHESSHNSKDLIWTLGATLTQKGVGVWNQVEEEVVKADITAFKWDLDRYMARLRHI